MCALFPSASLSNRDDDLEDLILKSEYADFLSKTGLDETHLRKQIWWERCQKHILSC